MKEKKKEKKKENSGERFCDEKEKENITNKQKTNLSKKNSPGKSIKHGFLIGT